jgi:hypothetical protein
VAWSMRVVAKAEEAKSAAASGMRVLCIAAA